MGGKRKICFILDSDLQHVALVGTAIKGICSLYRLSEEARAQIELAVVEAVNNCIIHSFDNQHGHKVKVDVCVDSKEIIIYIFDIGKPMGEIPSLSMDMQSNDISRIPESGRGLFIIHQTMDTVRYYSDETGNHLILRKTLERCKVKEEWKSNQK